MRSISSQNGTSGAGETAQPPPIRHPVASILMPVPKIDGAGGWWQQYHPSTGSYRPSRVTMSEGSVRAQS